MEANKMAASISDKHERSFIARNMVRLFPEAIYKFFKRSESSCGAANLDL